eukprot:c6570_g1_i1 orf=562-1674(-)
MELSETDEVPFRAPHDKPPFTLAQLKNAVPPHCFNRSLVRSVAYLVADLLISTSLFYASGSISIPGVLGLSVWAIYWIAQGCALTCLWVIAHECGHHAFSDYVFVDDLVGIILHSWLLVPYFSFKYSHKKHHSNTANIERDEVFLPKTRSSQVPPLIRLLNHPPGRLLLVFIVLTFGWPGYLIFNCSGRDYGRFTSHYDPNSPIFNSRQKLQVVVSDLALLVVVRCLYRIGVAYGFFTLLKVYAIPLTITNMFVVLITYLQHTHPSLPYYSDAEWEWLRGVLCTVDRDWGILNYVFHHVTDTHVMHHIFPMMPHYHAKEATSALKPVLGKYYQFDATPVYRAILREFKECVYVESASAQQPGVLWYQKLA